MKYTQDWFSPNIPNFDRVRELIGRPERVLEIGCFEGRSTCWMLEFLLPQHGHIVCVDSFKGGEEHADLDLSDLYWRFKHNTDIAKHPLQWLTLFQQDSFSALLNMAQSNTKLFDFSALPTGKGDLSRELDAAVGVHDESGLPLAAPALVSPGPSFTV